MSTPSPQQLRSAAFVHERAAVEVASGSNAKAHLETAHILRGAAEAIELLVEQRDALAEVAGIEPEWTEADA